MAIITEYALVDGGAENNHHQVTLTGRIASHFFFPASSFNITLQIPEDYKTSSTRLVEFKQRYNTALAQCFDDIEGIDEPVLCNLSTVPSLEALPELISQAEIKIGTAQLPDAFIEKAANYFKELSMLKQQESLAELENDTYANCLASFFSVFSPKTNADTQTNSSVGIDDKGVLTKQLAQNSKKM